MPATKMSDKYANLAGVNLTQTGANTDTFVKFNFPYSIQDKIALLISRVEYNFSAWSSLNSADDWLGAGLCLAGTLTAAMNAEDPLIIDYVRSMRADFGAAASGQLVEMPFVKDLSTLPGGGILVPPVPLYAYVASSGLAAAAGCQIRFYFTWMTLAESDYWQLVESRRLISD